VNCFWKRRLVEEKFELRSRHQRPLGNFNSTSKHSVCHRNLQSDSKLSKMLHFSHKASKSEFQMKSLEKSQVHCESNKRATDFYSLT
jgi:hypothetical protein